MKADEACRNFFFLAREKYREFKAHRISSVVLRLKGIGDYRAPLEVLSQAFLSQGYRLIRPENPVNEIAWKRKKVVALATVAQHDTPLGFDVFVEFFEER